MFIPITHATEVDQSAKILSKSMLLLENINRIFDPQCDTSIKESTLINDDRKEFPVSVITYEYLLKLYPEIENDAHIPFDYLEEGGEARAHEIARFLDKNNIVSAKAFLKGSLSYNTKKAVGGNVKWKTQTASVVRVIKDGKEINYVIDPSLFRLPVPFDEWAVRIGGNPEDVSFAPRFSYTHQDKKEELTDYRHEDLADVEKKFAKYKGILEKRSAVKDSTK